jgi:hypothetical protein
MRVATLDDSDARPMSGWPHIQKAALAILPAREESTFAKRGPSSPKEADEALRFHYFPSKRSTTQ